MLTTNKKGKNFTWPPSIVFCYKSKNTSSLRGMIFELLAHKWFTSQSHLDLKFQSLESADKKHTKRKARGGKRNVGPNGVEPLNLTVEGVMKRVDFNEMSEIRKAPQEVIYYQPVLKNFGALDSIIVDGVNDRCYGLQMTASHEHPLAWPPLNEVVKRLKEIDLFYQFRVCFVVPKVMGTTYKRQPILSQRRTVRSRPGVTGQVPQFVCGVDVFLSN